MAQGEAQRCSIRASTAAAERAAGSNSAAITRGREIGGSGAWDGEQAGGAGSVACDEAAARDLSGEAR
eukprot:567102-Rhodomonas_salina.1